MALKWCVFAFLFTFAIAQDAPCSFATKYSVEQLLSQPDARLSFLRDIHYWEGQFGQVGYNHKLGHTYDGHGIDYTTGELFPPLHNFSAPSKESMQNIMLAHVLDGNKLAAIFLSPNAPEQAEQLALTILTNKITSYENWDAKYPGYGGYLPWVYVNDTGLSPAGDYWAETVPSLDNGENIWAIYGVVQVMNNKIKQCSPSTQTCRAYISLLDRYSAYLNKLAANAYMIFYNGQGYVRSVTHINDIYAKPSPSNYVAASNFWLDDPYEGELFVWFLDLYGTWPNPSEREQVWINKRPKLLPIDLDTPQGPVTAQKGWVYSSHEQWKYLEMPYVDIPINKRVFVNSERARAWYSLINGTPGLHATVSNVTSGGPVTQYVDSGIPELSMVTNVSGYDMKLITPYATFPLFLVNQTLGLVWYWNHIIGPRMQGPYGSTESVYVTGTMISPVLTWDSKITTVASMNGGVVDMVRQGLKQDGKYQRFYDIVQREWTLAFPDLQGENIQIPLPSASIPHLMDPNYFTTCVPK